MESHSHLNGYEWLAVHQPTLVDEIYQVVEAVDATKSKTKKSEEQSKKGKFVYSPTLLNKAFKRHFNAFGWSASEVQFWVSTDYDLMRQNLELSVAEQRLEIRNVGLEAIRSKNQTDFTKNAVSIEVQFGKYSFIAYDLLVKHLAFFVSGKIEVGVEIVPMKSMQRHMSSGPGYYEKTLYDLARGGRGVPPVPLWILGVDA